MWLMATMLDDTNYRTLPWEQKGLLTSDETLEQRDVKSDLRDVKFDVKSNVVSYIWAECTSHLSQER